MTRLRILMATLMVLVALVALGQNRPIPGAAEQSQEKRIKQLENHVSLLEHRVVELERKLQPRFVPLTPK